MKTRIIDRHIVSRSSLQNTQIEDKANITATDCGYWGVSANNMKNRNTHIKLGLLGLLGLISNCSILRTDGSMSFGDGHAGMIYFNTSKRAEIVDRLVADFGRYDTTKYKNQIVWRDIEQKHWSDTLMRMKVLWTQDYGKDFESLAIAIVDYNEVVITLRKTDKVKIVKKYINEIRE